jgi:folate-binding protein YgfZ
MSDLRASFGDVTAEYRALRERAAVVTGSRECLWVRGPDAVAFLDGQLSQDIAGMASGSVSRSFLLEPRGKLLALLWVLRGDDAVGIITDAGRGRVTKEALERYRFRVAADIEDPRPIVELWGPDSAAVLARAALPVPTGWESAGSAVVASIPAGLPRFALDGVTERVLVDAGSVRAGGQAVTAVRIELGEPVMGVDVDESTIPQESGLVPESVSFTKGCYLGQELVARIDSRGRVNRHLRGLIVTTNVIPPEGAEIVAGDAVVGVVGSVGESLTVRAPVALGMVRREVEPGETVELVWEGGRTTAVVRELPLIE